MDGIANAVQHEPCGALRDFQRSPKFIGTDTVLAIGHEPHSGEPLVKTDCAVLKDRAHLDGELLLAIEAFPHQARPQKRHSFGDAARANWTVWPLRRCNNFKTYHRVREVANCFHQTLWKVVFICFHEVSVAHDVR